MRALVVAMVVLACVKLAHADSDDTIRTYIVLVGADTELTNALEDLFYAESTGVKGIGDRHAPSLAELGPASRDLADANGGSATVWLQPTGRGATLVTYDRRIDRFAVREVPYALPLTATQAAETARMVRTMLRALREQDDESAVTQPPPRPVRGSEPQWLPSIGFGAWFGAPDAIAAPMTTLALAWRPHGIGASVRATLAPASDLTTLTFEGDARVLALSATAHRSLAITPRLRVTPGVGFGLHRLALSGTFTGGDSVRSRRWNPTLGIGVVTGLLLAHRLELGVVVTADCLLRRQRYAAGTDELLEVSRVQGIVGIVLGVRL